MTLKSKSFSVYKGDTLEQVSTFINQEIGLDAYLIKGIQAVALNENVTQLTLLYNKYPDNILDSIAPREGSIFSSGVASNNFDIRFLFSTPIDFKSIYSGSFKIDDVDIDSGKVYLDPNSNNYYVKLSASGSAFQNNSFHTYQLSSLIKRSDGSSLPYSPVGGYVFNSLSSAYIGDYTNEYSNRRRGLVAVQVIRLSKNISPQQGVFEFFTQRSIPTDSLLFYSTTSTSVNSFDVYILYITKLEPQIIGGFPLNNSLLPSVSAPSKVTLVYNTQLDKSNLLSKSGLFTVEAGFNTSTPIHSNDLTLLSDLKTLEIDTSSYFTSEKVYSIVSRPGLLGINSQVKIKPEQWTIHISAYDAFTGSVSGSSTGAPTDANYILASGNASLPNAYVLAYKNSFTGIISGSSITLSGIGISEHFANISNPHSTTAAQVGSPTVAEFTGHTGASDAHTGYLKADGTRTVYGELKATTGAVDPAAYMRKAEVDAADAFLLAIDNATIASLNSHTGNLSNPHSVTASQVGSPTISNYSFLSGVVSGINYEFIGHTGTASIHFTQAQISVPSTQISDFTEAVQDVMGAAGFLSGLSGISISYSDSSNLVIVSMSGWLYTGITSHISDTGIHFSHQSISIPSTQVNDFTEAVQDIAGAMVQYGTGISGSYSDAEASITLSGIYATTSRHGIIKPSSSHFTVANGTVSLLANYIADPGGAAEGDMLYYNGGWAILPVGAEGAVLTIVGGVPTWLGG